ncbi:MAG: tRNA guanosine(34) transglycosylase Tgt [Candidatus Nomurabacteria bacterium]|jgi:queuine tRNA-ribosyltransferase|nr:tRNA guanosine(34) transglycosylase Tgt [Candidatus Nomurabacteria bacterium]
MLDFEIKKKNGLMRAGEITTPHGKIMTPAFIVAGTKAAVKAMSVPQVQDLGGQAILSNTYHLMLQPGVSVIAEAGGLAKFMGFDGATFTDSGGFQIMSLPKVKIKNDEVIFRSHINGEKLTISPRISMQAQHQIGADIHMAFDCPIGYGSTDTARENAEKTLRITHDWAAQSLAEHSRLNAEHLVRGENTQALFGVVQGGEFEDLRAKSARFFASMDFDGFGIGGMYVAEKSRKFLQIVDEILPDEKPRHWLGMGAEPIDIFTGVELGIDTFDCVAPTRQARNGALYTFSGRLNIGNAKYKTDFAPIDSECQCAVCQGGITRAYLSHLFRAGELLAFTLASIHNEFFVVNLTSRIRQSVLDGSFRELRDNFLGKYYNT